MVPLSMLPMQYRKSGSITIKVYCSMVPVPSGRLGDLCPIELHARAVWVRVGPRGLVWLMMLLMQYRKSGSITIKVCYQMVPVPSGRLADLCLMELRAQTVWVREGGAGPEQVCLCRAGPQGPFNL